MDRGISVPTTLTSDLRLIQIIKVLTLVPISESEAVLTGKSSVGPIL